MLQPSSQFVDGPNDVAQPGVDASTRSQRLLYGKGQCPLHPDPSFLPGNRYPSRSLPFKCLTSFNWQRQQQPPTDTTLELFNSRMFHLVGVTSVSTTTGGQVAHKDTDAHSISSIPRVSDVRLKSKSPSEETFASGVYPSFRFFSTASNAYIAKRNGTREVVAQARDPFSTEIEWEWIPQPQKHGAILRNKASGLFLCFNKNGRSTARKRFKSSHCLIHGFLPQPELILNQTPTSIRTKLDSQSQLHHLSPQYNAHLIKQPVLKSHHNSTTVSLPPPQARLSRWSREAKKPTDSLRSDSLTKFAVPFPVHLVSKMHMPPWYMGFCPGGRAFANQRPYSLGCPNFRLSRDWNLLLVCPPIPIACRRPECRPQQQTSASRTFSNKNNNNRIGGHRNGRKCSRACQMSVYCGGVVNVFRNVHF